MDFVIWDNDRKQISPRFPASLMNTGQAGWNYMKDKVTYMTLHETLKMTDLNW